MLYILLLIALMLLVTNLSTPGRFLSEMMTRSVAAMDTLRRGGTPTTELPAFVFSFPGIFFFVVPLIFQWILELGYLIYARGTVKGETMSYRSLFEGFNYFFKAIVIRFVKAMLVLVGLPLILPALWVLATFSQANLLLLDNPDRGAFWCLNQSRRLMRGHKIAYLLLFASFLGWELLATVPFISYAVWLWYRPYSTFTYIGYYNHLTGQTPQEPEWKRPGMF